MLFDLRSRGRRRTVRVVYAFLALIMVVGLVGLGIGTGNTGGILNADNNNGGGAGSNVSNQAVKQALKAVQKNPSAANWASLMSARYSAASSGSTTNSSTGIVTYSAAGKKQLQDGADAWEQYLKATTAKQRTGNSFFQNSFLAADIYQALGQSSNEAQAWNYALGAATGAEALKPSLCLSLASYAAKLKSKGDLAAAEAVKLSPKADRLTLKSALKAASSAPTTAQGLLVSEGC